MQTDVLSRILAGVNERSHGVVFDLPDGATFEFLTPPTAHDQFCVIRGMMPPGGIVPLHSHDDTEAFLVVSGSKQLLTQGSGGLEWNRVRAGDYVHVASGTPHAWRNDTSEPTVDLIVTTKRMGEFFQEVSRPAGTAGPPSAEDLARLAALAAKYGYWLATPGENAAVGIELPFPALDGASV